MSRSRTDVRSVTFPKARWLFWHVLAVHVYLGCKKRWESGNLSGTGKRLEFKFRYTKELLFWAKFVGRVLVCFCKCLSLVPVNASTVSRSLPPRLSVSICIPPESFWILYFCPKKPALWLRPCKFSEKLIRRVALRFVVELRLGIKNHYVHSSVLLQGRCIHRKMVFHWNIFFKQK